MIGPLLRVAASSAAARSLRNAAHDVATRAMLAMGAALAIGVGEDTGLEQRNDRERAVISGFAYQPAGLLLLECTGEDEQDGDRHVGDLLAGREQLDIEAVVAERIAQADGRLEILSGDDYGICHDSQLRGVSAWRRDFAYRRRATTAQRDQ